MNYDKTKTLEASILDAIKKHDCDPVELTKFAEKCFSAYRVESLNETKIKNLNEWLKHGEQEIARHKICIKDLRGYIGFLETENEKLKQEREE